MFLRLIQSITPKNTKSIIKKPKHSHKDKQKQIIRDTLRILI